jgi:hypothetical protein
MHVDSAAIATLVKNLIEADHELLVSERKAARRLSPGVQPGIMGPTTPSPPSNNTNRASAIVETYLVNKRSTPTDNRIRNQVYGLSVAKNSTGSSSLRVSKGPHVTEK